jgi:hypothetical protein
MGEAARRGTRDERIAQAQERERAAKEARAAEARAWWESLTEEERAAKRDEWATQDAKRDRTRAMLAAMQLAARRGI